MSTKEYSEVNEMTLGPQSFHPQTRVEQFELISSLLTVLAEQARAQTQALERMEAEIKGTNAAMFKTYDAVQGTERIVRQMAMASAQSQRAVAIERAPATKPARRKKRK